MAPLNHWGISLLYTISKLYKDAIAKQLRDYLEKKMINYAMNRMDSDQNTHALTISLPNIIFVKLENPSGNVQY